MGLGRYAVSAFSFAGRRMLVTVRLHEKANVSRLSANEKRRRTFEL